VWRYPCSLGRGNRLKPHGVAGEGRVSGLPTGEPAPEGDVGVVVPPWTAPSIRSLILLLIFMIWAHSGWMGVPVPVPAAEPAEPPEEGRLAAARVGRVEVDATGVPEPDWVVTAERGRLDDDVIGWVEVEVNIPGKPEPGPELEPDPVETADKAETGRLDADMVG